MRNIRVLVVDDNPQLLRLMAMWLETLSDVQEVVPVSSTQLALDYLSQDVPGLVLINWHMECAHGASNVSSHLKSRSDSTNIVVMTDSGSLNPANDAVVSGADICIEKADLFRELPLFLADRFRA